MAMAERVNALLEQRPGARLVVWAHDVHVMNETDRMGGALKARWGDDYVPIAFAAVRGPYHEGGPGGRRESRLLSPVTAELEHLLAAADPGPFVLDLRLAEADSGDSGWLLAPESVELFGADTSSERFGVSGIARRFDLVVSLGATSPSGALP
jgi:erythromycin esterase